MEDQQRGIRWTPFTILEDLDFADDLALLSHTRQHIQETTDRLSMFSNQVGLRTSLKKTETMCVKCPFPNKDQGKRTGHSIHHQVHILPKCALPRWGY